MARQRPGAVFATPIARSAVTWDALGENILMVFQFAPTGNAVYEMTPDGSRELTIQIQDLLAERPDARLQ